MSDTWIFDYRTTRRVPFRDMKRIRTTSTGEHIYASQRVRWLEKNDDGSVRVPSELTTSDTMLVRQSIIMENDGNVRICDGLTTPGMTLVCKSVDKCEQRSWGERLIAIFGR